MSTTDGKGIQRYDFSADGSPDGWSHVAVPHESVDGEYVLFTDHLAALEDAKAEAREELKRELRRVLGNVCFQCDHYEYISARLAEIERGEP
jgi:hypothetical protein